MSQVQTLEIGRNPSYGENAGQFYGKVTIAGENGRQEIRLTPVTICAIFDIIRQQSAAMARANANTVADAISDAAAEVNLLANTVIEGEKS